MASVMCSCAVCKKMKRAWPVEKCRVQKVIASGAVNNVEIDFLIDEVNAEFIEKSLYSLPPPPTTHEYVDGSLHLKSFICEQDLRKKFMKLGSQGVNISLKAEIQQVKAKLQPVQTQISLAQQQLDEAIKIDNEVRKQITEAAAAHNKELSEAEKSPSNPPTDQSLHS